MNKQIFNEYNELIKLGFVLEEFSDKSGIWLEYKFKMFGEIPTTLQAEPDNKKYYFAMSNKRGEGVDIEISKAKMFEILKKLKK